MYKTLSSEDYVVGHSSLIEPVGVNSGGVVASNERDYGIISINPAASLDQKRKYRQFANIILGDAEKTLPFGETGVYFAIKRNNFKESIHVGSCRVNNKGFRSGSSEVVPTNAGSSYYATDYSSILYPDIGTILSASPITSVVACSEQNIPISYAFVRAGASEFNYSTNPSFLNSNDYIRFPDWGDNPVTYITTIGFYNDNGDCLAVAKLPKPFKKDFTTEFLASVQFKF